MKYSIILSLKRGRFASDMTDELARLCSIASPFYSHEKATFFGLTSDRSIFYYFSSNEGRGLSELVNISKEKPNARFINFYYGDGVPTDRPLVLPGNKLHRHVNKSTGRFSFISIDSEKNSFAAATTINRIDPIYQFENGELIAVGTWAYSINEVLSNLRAERFGSSQIFSFMNAGFFGNDDTFYDGVRATRPFSTLYLANRSLSENYEFGKIFSGEAGNNFEGLEADDYYERITEDFIKGIRHFSAQGSAQLQLSGGKDSRLVVAGLSVAGIEVSANTTDGGSHNFTDVYCAKLVARSLGVNHNLIKTAKRNVEATISVDAFYKRTVDALKATDFGLIALGNLAYNPVFNDVRVFNGLGGELLRGGYSKGLAKQKITYNPHSLLISKWGRFHKFFYKHAAESYSQYISEWLEENNLNNNLDLAADAGYIYCRMGRWAAALVRSGSLARRPTYPLLDNAFIHSVYSAPVEFRSNDRLLYEVLKRLNPTLVELPLANDYWAFWTAEQVMRMKETYPDAFRERGDHKSGANLDWRANWVEVISEHLFDFILSHPSSEVFDIVDRIQIENLRQSDLNYGHRFLLFGVYSAIIACSPEFVSGVYSCNSSSLNDFVEAES